MSMEEITSLHLVISLVLVAIALYFSVQFKLRMEKEIIIATIRATVQLIIIGYILSFVFSLDSPIYTIMMIAVMGGIATVNAGKRGKDVKGAMWISGVSIFASTIVTIGILSGFDIIPFNPQYIIPVAGMIIGNVMSAASVSLIRLQEELKSNRGKVEAALSLGATPRKAVEEVLKKAVRISMVPVVDRAKIVGIVSLPGGMSGMILAGASPLSAVKFQILIMYMLLGSPFLTVGIAVLLAYRQYFTKHMQLKI